MPSSRACRALEPSSRALAQDTSGLPVSFAEQLQQFGPTAKCSSLPLEDWVDYSERTEGVGWVVLVPRWSFPKRCFYYLLHVPTICLLLC